MGAQVVGVGYSSGEQERVEVVGSDLVDGGVHGKRVGPVEVVEGLDTAAGGGDQSGAAPGVTDRVPGDGELHLFGAFRSNEDSDVDSVECGAGHGSRSPLGVRTGSGVLCPEREGSCARRWSGAGHAARCGARQAPVGTQGEQAVHGVGAALFHVGPGRPGVPVPPPAVLFLRGSQRVEVGVDLRVGEEGAGPVVGAARQVQRGVGTAVRGRVEGYGGAEHGGEAGEFGAGSLLVGRVLEEEADRFGFLSVGPVQGRDALPGEGGGAVPPLAGGAVLVQ